MPRQALPIAAVAILSLLLVAGVPVAHADTLNSVTVTPSSCVTSSCAPNTVVTITISGTVDSDSEKSIGLVVSSPNGDVYTLSPGIQFDNMGGGASTMTCSVPFGGAGTLSSTASGPGMGFVTSCSGSNSGAWELVTGANIASEETADCNPGVSIVSTGEGSTAQGGMYTVIGCYVNVSYTTAQFFITSTTTTTVTSPTTTTITVPTTTTETTTTTISLTSPSTTTTTATLPVTSTATATDTSTVLSGTCYDPDVTVTQTVTSSTTITETSTETLTTTLTGTVTTTVTSTTTVTTSTIVPVTTTTTSVTDTTVCATTVTTTSSSSSPALGVPQFPAANLGAALLAVLLVPILALMARSRRTAISNSVSRIIYSLKERIHQPS